MTRSWQQILREKRNEILDRWSARSSGLLRGHAGQGSLLAGALAVELGSLLDALAGGQAVDEPLLRLTRILAVQEASPSESLSIIPALSLLSGIHDEHERTLLRDRLDEVLLQAFDRFMQHRETIYQLKVDEGHRRMHMALRRVEA